MTYREMLAFIATIDSEYLDADIVLQASDADGNYVHVSVDDAEKEAGACTGPFLVGSITHVEK